MGDCGSLRLWAAEVRGLQRIISNRSAGGQTNVHDGGPAFQFVVAVAMKKIRCADGNAGAGRFDGRKTRMIIHHVIGQKNFLAARVGAYSRSKNNPSCAWPPPRQRTDRFPCPKSCACMLSPSGQAIRMRARLRCGHCAWWHAAFPVRAPSVSRTRASEASPIVFVVSNCGPSVQYHIGCSIVTSSAHFFKEWR